MNPLLRVSGLVKRYRGVTASNGLDFEVLPGELHAVIGPNGAGKTTLISQLAGETTPDEGRVTFEGLDITGEPVHERALRGIARSYQITSVFEKLSVLENVMLAVQARVGHSFRFIGDAAGDATVSQPAFEALESVGLGALVHEPAGSLAHGARRQLELAIVLAMRPRLMLLDEPMAGTGPEESQEIVRLLQGLRGTVSIVLIEHDLQAVFALADRISVLVYGKVIACGSPEEIRNDPEVRRAYIGEEEDIL